MLGPTIDQLAEETKGKLKVGKVDIDHHRNIAMQYGIQSIPTVFLQARPDREKVEWFGFKGGPD